MMSTLKNYIELTRLDKPIGILLLLWPTLWAVWLASHGRPDYYILFVFSLGVVLMRSAGCIINDIADRHFDKHVKRTAQRPLASEKITVTHAFILFGILTLAAFLLVLTLNRLVIELACIALLFAMIYPLLKRVTYLPQVGLGIAFAWGVPMAFAAVKGFVPSEAWIVFLAAALWPVIYDTMYAMSDREEDIKIGVKSTAILFGQADIFMIICLQIVFLILLLTMGYVFSLSPFYYYTVILVVLNFMFQIYLMRDREPEQCLKAFLNNRLVGMFIFLGIFGSFI